MATCNACNSVLERVEYQARAADEAHRIIDVCPSCPVDASKLVIRVAAPGRLSCFQQPKPPLHVRSLSLAHTRIGTEVVFEAVVDSDIYTSLDTEHFDLFNAPRGIRQQGDVATPLMGVEHASQHGTNGVRHELQKANIALGCTSQSYDIYATPQPVNASLMQVASRYKVISQSDVHLTTIHCEFDGRHKQYYIRRTHRGRPPMYSEARFITDVYAAGGMPTTLRASLSAGKCSTLMNLCSRAWDVSSVEGEGFIFTNKVDGERRWLVVCGYAGYVVRRSRLLNVCGWYPLQPPRDLGVQEPIVVDCEYTPARGLVFIDMLTDASGQLAPPDRTAAWAFGEYVAVKRLYTDLPVYLREYYQTPGEVRPTPGILEELSDGIVAIHVDSTSARKIKTIKSVELVVSDAERGTLETSDGTIVFDSIKLPEGIDTGNIVEVRFEPDGNTGNVTVHDCFRRVDKTKANSSVAVAHILDACIESKNDDQNDRRRALLWCNSLKTHINTTAETLNSPQAIIIDVGTGDGQALDSMNLHNQSVSRILVEPDRDKCARLCARLRKQLPPRGCDQLRSSVRQLKVRKSSVMVVNCTLGDILSDTELCTVLMPEVRIIVSTFSIHFVVKDLSRCHRDWGVPVIGCTYVYDGVDIGKPLVDSCGVLMARTTARECTVQWGRDTKYTEPYTTSMDYGSFTNPVVATEVLEKAPSNSDRFMSVCKHVYCFMPK